MWQFISRFHNTNYFARLETLGFGVYVAFVLHFDGIDYVHVDY